MRIQILSDLHVECDGNTTPPLAAGAELVILAGDLAPVHTRRVVDIAKRWAGADRILYVSGNHEYYGSDIEAGRRELARQCVEHGVTLLDRSAVTIDNVRFIGATLWTDFRLEASALGEAWAHHEASQTVPDFIGAIRDSKAPGGLLTTQETARRHGEDRAFIERELGKARDEGLTPLVITHHAPSPRCIRPWYEKSRWNPAFASNLDALIEKYEPVLWVHGHMHDPVDEWVGTTRIIANPHGYSRVEGHTFNPALVVDVPSERHRER